MARPATVTIDLEAIAHNYRLAKSLAPGQQALAVIKANAYGHGAVPVARKLKNEADAFAVACIEEAMELRMAGIRNPILLLEGFFSADELTCISEHNLWTAVHHQQQIDDIARASLKKPLHIWLKLDTGMHRLGFSAAAYPAAWQQLNALPQVANITLLSHFSSADEPHSAATAAQLQCLDTVVRQCPSAVSIANSAATLIHSAAHRQWQRPGIMLYGASPFAQPQTITQPLRPAMTLSTEIIAIHDLQAGDAIGYAGTWVCEQATRVGTIALGYADGYPRQAKNGTPVIVNGQRTRIIGRVSMDMITVDLTGLNARVGDPVELWGRQLPANDVAACCDTIAYTLFTGISRRVHRRYTGLQGDHNAV